MRWNDPRLNYRGLFDEDTVTVHPSLLEKIWMPDLFFANEKKANFHKVTQDNKLVRIYQSGSSLRFYILYIILWGNQISQHRKNK